MTDTMTMGDARTRYYEVNGFGADGGDSLKWVPIKVLGITIYIPNTEGRRRAVRIHDLHHIVTGYQTTFTGEAEIAAWELASGCWQWPAAFVLNLGGLGMGMLIAPQRAARAWARGRKTRNLYTERNGVDHVLPRPVGEVRAVLGLDEPAPPVRARDALAVAAVGLPMLATIAAVVAAPLVAAALLVAAIT
ncbi:MAG TPA: hypothetical protein VNO30_22095 [Kofleriaceae bacterium]|nr:hypothetical protein [Kofleriaceae bacterium]